MSVGEKISVKRSISISDIERLAQKYDGSVLTKEYVNSRTPITFKCKEGHIFKKRYTVIENGSWCSECNTHVGEAISRVVMNTYFGCQFDHVRPKWLDGLELDGYNEDLRLAFEYDGVQHHKFIKKFHANEQVFKDQQARDKKKDALCEANNVRLIRIPYTVKNCDIPLFIKNELIKKNIDIPNDVPVDYAKTIGGSSNNKEKICELKKLIETREGTLISELYVDMFTAVEIECNKGHKFYSNYYTLKYKKGWCGMCTLKSKFTVDELNYTLKSFDMSCNSTEIVSFRSEMTFEHKCGEIWSSTVSDIRKGERCPRCFPETKVVKRRILKIDDSGCDDKGNLKIVTDRKPLYEKMMNVVIEKGGEMISNECDIINRMTNLAIRCNKGHVFEKSYTNLIIQKTWCHSCGTKKKTIKDMHMLATKYNGRCLSDVYSNNTLKLKWECEHGHIFWRTPLLITTKKIFCMSCNQNNKN
ncbi:hypothetical protein YASMINEVIRUS_1095 [Yasminevirus sp. GU-2018]|uniref:Zinc-ribbon domain-containing protein n=1 Tax=Yasminevirus sp. GU-2018 TaxID=2420051 RepID=A0A5K0UAA3_9VIRU|nr:hypothetical protein YASMINEVIRUS_1095 [Yasminevirus sp. GU-2018]